MFNEPRKPISFARADQHAVEPVQWLIDGWLVQDSLAALVGPSGSGKSFLAIDWAVRVATGTPWHGRTVKQGAVFVLAGEGRNGLRKRIAGMETGFGIPITGAPLFLADCLPALTDPGNARAVVDEITAVAEKIFFESGHEPALVIVDTVARAMAGANENSSEDMGRFIQSMDWIRQRYGACVLSVHHTGHGSETQDRARGSSAYRAALDSEFVTKTHNQTVSVRATKCKDWSAPAPLTLTKQPVDVEVATSNGIQRTSTLVLRDPVGAVLECQRREQVFQLQVQGGTVRQIAELTGISRSTVQRWLTETRREHDEAFAE